MEVEGIARYVRGMVGVARIHPNILPTQSSGRWSTTNPPLVNFPAHAEDQCPHEHSPGVWCPRDVRRVIIPDDGWHWLHFDYSALHAYIAAHYCRDQRDLDAFANGWDLHTLTACGMFGWSDPPVKTKALHTAPECEVWRQSVKWTGAEDRRRHIAKTVRYALLMGLDERASLESHELVKLGLGREEILDFGRKYLRAKPSFVDGRRKAWASILQTGEARSLLYGRRRRFYWAGEIGRKSTDTVKKEGWSHMIQGTETDMGNTVIRDIGQGYPQAVLVLNSHDGQTWAFPDGNPAGPEIRALVEREWFIDGRPLTVPASWKRFESDGTFQAWK